MRLLSVFEDSSVSIEKVFYGYPCSLHSVRTHSDNEKNPPAIIESS